MKFNTDPSFIGFDELKKTHQAQITKFEQWATEDSWERFHSSHYDWWVFPINHHSSYGAKYVVYEGEVEALKGDAQFVERYKRGVELVSASWGWDLFLNAYFVQLKPGQSWHRWPVRLYKAALSVQLFGYHDLFDSLKLLAQDLMRKGEEMKYNSKDLSWLFK